MRSLHGLAQPAAVGVGRLAAVLYLRSAAATVGDRARRSGVRARRRLGPALAAELAAGLLLLAAALGPLGHRSPGRFAPLLVLAALAWPLAEWDAPAQARLSRPVSSCTPRGRRCWPPPRCAGRTSGL